MCVCVCNDRALELEKDVGKLHFKILRSKAWQCSEQKKRLEKKRNREYLEIAAALIIVALAKQCPPI